MFAILALAAIGRVVVSAENLCTDANIQRVGRIVYGEARGESAEGQLAVAYTVVNRVNNHDFNYPNTVQGVVNQRYGSNHEYNTLDYQSHTEQWNKAKDTNSATYRNAIDAAEAALCDLEPDPTGCALAYCAHDPCSATDNTRYAEAYNKQQIGNHYFVCQRPISGK